MNLKVSKGFTIVELLIVIVVIAILAAISIVAYTGIQDRARNSAAVELANQFAGKVRAYQAVTGNLPTGISSNAFTPEANPPAPEANLDGISAKVTVDTTTAAGTDPANPAPGNAFWGGTNIIWQTLDNKVWYRTGGSTKAAVSL